MRAATQPPPAAAGRVDELLGRIGAELGRVADDLSRIGSDDGDPPGDGARLRPSWVVALQGVDRAEQTTRDLARVLQGLAEADLASGVVDLPTLLRGACLDQTAAVVRGVDRPPAVSGEMEMF